VPKLTPLFEVNPFHKVAKNYSLSGFLLKNDQFEVVWVERLSWLPVLNSSASCGENTFPAPGRKRSGYKGDGFTRLPDRL
jgi:hypothetical protein